MSRCILHSIQRTRVLLFITVMFLAISFAGPFDEFFTTLRHFKVHFAQFPSPFTLKNVNLLRPFFRIASSNTKHEQKFIRKSVSSTR